MHFTAVLWILLGIVVVEYVWGQVLSGLNRSCMSDVPPPVLQDVYDGAEYARQQQYQRTNDRFSQVVKGLNLMVLLVVLFVGGIGWFEVWLSEYVTSHFVLLPLVFFTVVLLGTSVLSLPLDYYDTFVIEQRFGFNTSTRKLFFVDAVKSFLLGLGLGGAVLALVACLYQLMGPSFWLLAWAALTLLSVGIGYFYAEVIVPLFNKQTLLEEGELRDKLSMLAKRAGFELKDIYVLDASKRSTKSNAFFTGFGKRKRIVLFDTLLNDLEDDEIVGVLAHEIGHYRKHHILITLVIGVVNNGVTLWLLSLFLGSVELAKALGRTDGQPSFLLGLIGFGLLYSPVSGLLSVAQSAISRRHEYQADQYAAGLGLADQLISGLKKISARALSNLTPHPLVVFWDYTHPTLLQRIRRLGTSPQAG